MSRPGGDYLIGRWRYVLMRSLRRIWFRASLFSLGAVLTALLGAAAGHLPAVPFELAMAAASVDNILTILASSMLAVTTFSLSIMVNAYAFAESNSTPRVTSLLIGDSIAANTLATFVGSFLFGIVGIIGLTMGIYGAQGRVVLFFSTLIVLFFVTASLLRWIEQLTRFGRIADTIWRVEKKGSVAARSWAGLPRMGAREPVAIPASAAPLYVEEAGHIQHIDMDELDELAARSGGRVHLLVLPGQFVGPNMPVARLESEPDGNGRAEMLACFTVARERGFGQDPRFGLVVLSEIASRALSPAVNDPGTAIQVLTAGVRVILAYCEEAGDRAAARFDWLHAPDMAPEEMLEDLFNPIARDGAGMLEVQLRLQRSLQMIALANNFMFEEAARRMAAVSLKRALAKMDSPLEKTRLRRAADWARAEEEADENTAD